MKSKVALIVDKKMNEFTTKSERLLDGTSSTIKSTIIGRTNGNKEDITETVEIMSHFISQGFTKTLAGIYNESYNENWTFIASMFNNQNKPFNLLGANSAVTIPHKSAAYSGYLEKYKDRTKTQLGDLLEQLI